jgi:signal transduction histidine kinase
VIRRLGSGKAEGIEAMEVSQMIALPRSQVSAGALTMVITAIYAVLDFNVPGEISVAILYASSVAAAGWTRSPRFLWLTTAVSVLLAYAGLVYGPQPDAPHDLKALYINRSFVALSLVMIAAIVHQRMQMACRVEEARDAEARKNQILRETEDELRHVNEELERRVDREVSRRIKVEQSLHQAQKMEAIGQLTGSIAHDFNNVLTTVIGNLDLIQNNLAADDPRRRLAINAQLGAEQGSQLVKRLLSFARQQPLDAQVVDIESELSGVVALARPIVREGIALSIDVGANLWQCYVDRTQLQAALLNLVINARDAISGLGCITLSARKMSFLTETADLSSGDYVRISVQDTGTGMPPEVVARVFEPFFTTKPADKGSGLGLSAAYGFVRQSGGTVRIETAPGEGTTVHVYLPRTRMPALPEAVISKAVFVAEAADHDPIVEDEEGMRQPATKALEVARPALTASSAEVVDVASEQSFPASDPPAWIWRDRTARADAGGA